MKLALIPAPKKMSERPGVCRARAVTESIVPGFRPEAGYYGISISETGTLLEAAEQSGLFYARQTLAQIDIQFPKLRPCLDILDWPDFRGCPSRR